MRRVEFLKRLEDFITKEVDYEVRLHSSFVKESEYDGLEEL